MFKKIKFVIMGLIASMLTVNSSQALELQVDHINSAGIMEHTKIFTHKYLNVMAYDLIADIADVLWENKIRVSKVTKLILCNEVWDTDWILYLSGASPYGPRELCFDNMILRADSSLKLSSMARLPGRSLETLTFGRLVIENKSAENDPSKIDLNDFYKAKREGQMPKLTKIKIFKEKTMFSILHLQAKSYDCSQNYKDLSDNMIKKLKSVGITVEFIKFANQQ